MNGMKRKAQVVSTNSQRKKVTRYINRCNNYELIVQDVEDDDYPKNLNFVTIISTRRGGVESNK